MTLSAPEDAALADLVGRVLTDAQHQINALPLR